MTVGIQNLIVKYVADTGLAEFTVSILYITQLVVF